MSTTTNGTADRDDLSRDVLASVRKKFVEAPIGTTLKLASLIGSLGFVPIAWYLVVDIHYVPTITWDDLILPMALALLASALLIAAWLFLLTGASEYWKELRTKTLECLTQGRPDGTGSNGPGTWPILLHFGLPVTIATLVLGFASWALLDTAGNGPISTSIVVGLLLLTLLAHALIEHKKSGRSDGWLLIALSNFVATAFTSAAASLLYLLASRKSDTALRSAGLLLGAFLLVLLFQVVRLSRRDLPVWLLVPSVIALLLAATATSEKHFFFSHHVVRTLRIGQYYETLTIGQGLGISLNQYGGTWQCGSEFCREPVLMLFNLGTDLLVQDCSGNRHQIPKGEVFHRTRHEVGTEPCRDQTDTSQTQPDTTAPP